MPDRPVGAIWGSGHDPAAVERVLEMLAARRPDGRAQFSYRQIEAETGIPYTTVRRWFHAIKAGKIRLAREGKL